MPDATILTLEAPIAVRRFELNDPPLGDVELGTADDGRNYSGVYALVTSNGVPAGDVTLAADAAGVVSGAELAAALAEIEAREAPAETDENLKIAVVTAVIDGGARVGRMLDSLFACGYDNFEAVVVNNRPENGVLTIDPAARSATDPRVTIVDEPKHGPSAARNTGAAATSGEIILFIDDDVVAEPSLLKTVAAAFANHADARCVTGLIVPYALETNAQLMLERYAGFSKGFEPKAFSMARNADDRLFPFAPGRFGSGAVNAWRRSAFEQLGGFDEVLGPGTPTVGGEDLDLFMREILGGGELRYEPGVAVWHEHPDSDEQFPRQVFNYGVGLSSVISKQLFAGNARRRLLRAVPSGLALGLQKESEKNARKGGEFPLSLTIREMLGMAAGPLRFLRSRRIDRGLPPSRVSTIKQAPALTFTPAFLGEVEISEPVGPLETPVRADGRRFVRARLLVRLHGAPLGQVELALDADGGASAELVRATIESELGATVWTREVERPQRPDPAPLVSVMIATRNRAEHLRMAIASVLAVDYPNLELIIVDNGPSDDSTRRAVEAFADPRVHYFREEIGGTSRARNRGLLEADGEFIAVIDDDVEVDPGWIDGLLDGFQRGDHVGLVTGLVVSAELENEFQEYFEQQVQWANNYEARLYDLNGNSSSHPLYPYALGALGTGANFAVRADAARGSKPFDEALGGGVPTGGGEDLDYFLQMLFCGWQIVYAPRALVHHHHRADAESLRRQMYIYGTGAMAYGFKAATNPRHTVGIAARFAKLLMRRLSGEREYGFDTGQGDLREVQREGLRKGPGLYVKSRRVVRGRPPVARTRS